MLTSHCTSLELSLALRESGYPQEGSTFVHIKTKHAKGIYFVTEAIRPLLAMPDTEWCAAPLASEILTELPKRIGCHYLNITKAEDDGFYVTYGEGNIGGEHKPILANALAKLWRYLRQEKLI